MEVPTALAPSQHGGEGQASGLAVALRGRPLVLCVEDVHARDLGSPTDSNLMQPTLHGLRAVRPLLQLPARRWEHGRRE